jgi:kynureninase
VLPRATASRVAQVVQQEWGEQLIESWNTPHWIDLPQRVGDKIASLVGAGAGELVVADSTSVNLFKVLSAAMSIAQADAPARRVVLSERRQLSDRPLHCRGRWRASAASTLVLVDDPNADRSAPGSGRCGAC